MGAFEIIFDPTTDVSSETNAIPCATRDGLVSGIRQQLLLNRADRRQQRDLKQLSCIDTEMHLVVTQYGATAAIAEWEASHYHWVSKTGGGIASSGPLVAVSVLLTGIDPNDEANAVQHFRSRRFQNNKPRDRVQKLLDYFKLSPRPIIATNWTDKADLQVLVPCVHALAEAFFGEFGDAPSGLEP